MSVWRLCVGSLHQEVKRCSPAAVALFLTKVHCHKWLHANTRCSPICVQQDRMFQLAQHTRDRWCRQRLLTEGIHRTKINITLLIVGDTAVCRNTVSYLYY